MFELSTLKINESWEPFIFNKNIEDKLKEISNKLKGSNFFPYEKEVLRFLEQDITNIKGIILGIDPYPSYFKDNNGNFCPEATGRSFEIRSVTDWNQKFKQASLRNILKTIYLKETGKKESLEYVRNKIDSGEFMIAQPRDWFNSLENQGILFLNSTLTVEIGLPNSHAKIWEDFMKELFSYVFKNTPHNTKWLLWGKAAQNAVMISDKLEHEKQYVFDCHPRLAEFVKKDNSFNKVDIDWLGKA